MATEVTPEIKALIDAAVEEATTGLASKNKELLADLKKARKVGEITPEQLAEVEGERDKAQTDLAKVQKDLKAATTNTEKLQKSLDTESSFTQNLLVDNGLVSELTKHGVTNPVHIKAAQALLRSGVQIVADGDKRVAKVGDKDLASHVKEWAAGEEGKHFVTAAVNGGGGASGGSGKGAGKTMTRAEYDTKNAAGDPSIPTFFKEGGKLEG